MLSIPLEQVERAQEAAGPSKILIVDDDETMVDVLSMRLTSQGFTTIAAENGQQALRRAQAELPDLIVLDLRLPDVDGFELCQQLVDDELTSEIPVIIVSGLESPDVLRRSRAAGCHFFVSKPYDPNALLTLIQRALEESRAA